LVHRHDRVERRLQDRAQARLARANLLLRVPARDELADLAAESAHRLEQPLVGLAKLPREELHHADDPPGAAQREPERRVEAGASRSIGARKVPVGRRVRHPHRLAAQQHPSGKAVARREDDPLAERRELRRTIARRPGARAAQRPLVGPHLPHRPELPPE
jgi:hypothetical protein